MGSPKRIDKQIELAINHRDSTKIRPFLKTKHYREDHQHNSHRIASQCSVIRMRPTFDHKLEGCPSKKKSLKRPAFPR